MAEELPTPEDETQPQNTGSGLTPEEIAHMEQVQKKRLVIMIIAGVVFLVLGFLAGQHLGSLKSAADGYDAVLAGWAGAGWLPSAPSTTWIF